MRDRSRTRRGAALLIGALGAQLVAAVLFASAAGAQSAEEKCASLKSQPQAYQQCVDTVRKSEQLISSQPTASPAPASTDASSGKAASDASMASQRRIMVFAIIGALVFVVVVVGLSFWRWMRKTAGFPVAELTALMETMIPPEVKAENPGIHAAEMPARGGKTGGKFMVLSYVIAAVVIAGAIGIVALGGANYIWLVPIVLLPAGVFYAWFVVRRVTKSADEWLIPLGLHVSGTPTAIVGPNPSGLVGGPALRPYVVGASTIEGQRFGREVKITQQPGGINSTSVITLVRGPGPMIDASADGGTWQGRIPEGPVSSLVMSTSPGPGKVHLIGDGQGLTINRTISSRQLISRDGYGVMIRDLHLAEQIIDAAAS